jgi:asparagine synthetase B (glutamine-hydrolysing)
MCGISTAVALDSLKTPALNEEASSFTLEIQLNDCLDEIEYRGPDARGWWVSQDNRIGEIRNSSFHR